MTRLPVKPVSPDAPDAPGAPGGAAPRTLRTVLRTIVLFGLVASLGIGAYVANDSAAVDSANQNITRVNKVTADLRMAIQFADPAGFATDKLMPLYDAASKVVQEKGGGHGYIDFLTRREIADTARDCWYAAASMRVVLGALMADRALVEAALVDYDEAEKVCAADGKPRPAMDMVRAVRALLAASGDALDADAMRTGVIAAFDQ